MKSYVFYYDCPNGHKWSRNYSERPALGDAQMTADENCPECLCQGGFVREEINLGDVTLVVRVEVKVQ